MLKIWNLGLEGEFMNLIKGVWDESTVNAAQLVLKTECCPFEIRSKTRLPASSTSQFCRAHNMGFGLKELRLKCQFCQS